jgi:hypothetical protein
MGERQMMRKMTITFTSCEFTHCVVIAIQAVVRYGFMILSWIWFGGGKFLFFDVLSMEGAKD